MVRVVPHPLPCPGAGSPAAYLRVYEPLAAFSPPARIQWQRYAAAAAPRSSRLAAEHRSALAGVLSLPPQPVPAEEQPEAFVIEADDTAYVCPVQARLRSWVALGRFREALPEQVVHAFVPPLALERVEAEHAGWASTEQARPLRILTTAWTVPVPWFVPFSPSDRITDLTAEVPSVVHRTRMSTARRRVARGLRALRESVGELDLTDELVELGQWLEEWHPRSWVELDYAGLSRLAGSGGRGRDTSVADVARALAALAAGDDEEAAQRYRSVVQRWDAIAALEHAN